jgi:hypothetical protein
MPHRIWRGTEGPLATNSWTPPCERSGCALDEADVPLGNAGLVTFIPFLKALTNRPRLDAVPVVISTDISASAVLILAGLRTGICKGCGDTDEQRANQD